MRRIRSTSVEDINEVATLLAVESGPIVVVLDADNTLVRQGASHREFAEIVNRVIDRLENITSVERVIVISNGPHRGVERAISGGGKPWTSRRRLGIRGGSAATIWIVGDQVVTDGLLAWRLGGQFLHCVIDPDDAYPRQATMRRLGRLIAPLIFRRSK